MAKPKGYMKYILAMDCETTGLSFGTDDPSIGHQAISWGLIVADTATLKPVDEMYVEIRWNDDMVDKRMDDKSFGKKAEEIHGLTLAHLEEHGKDEEDAVADMAEFILQYWSPTSCIQTLGHNVATFDLPFFRSTFRRNGIELKFGNRHYDTNSGGFMAFETYTSDQLFELCGFDARDSHNALEDARMSLACARTIRVLMNNLLD